MCAVKNHQGYMGFVCFFITKHQVILFLLLDSGRTSGRFQSHELERKLLPSNVSGMQKKGMMQNMSGKMLPRQRTRMTVTMTIRMTRRQSGLANEARVPKCKGGCMWDKPLDQERDCRMKEA